MFGGWLVFGSSGSFGSFDVGFGKAGRTSFDPSDDPDDDLDDPGDPATISSRSSADAPSNSTKRSNNQSLTNSLTPLQPNPQSGHPNPLATTVGRARGIEPAEEKERVRLEVEGRWEVDRMWSVS